MYIRNMAQYMMTPSAGLQGFPAPQGISSNVQWTVTPDERKGHDKQFDQLGPMGGFLRGDQARVFFLKSNLPPAVLGQIWELADFTGDGKMDKLEFSIAMKLIKLKLQGVTLPTVLPASMKQQQSSFNLSSYAQAPLSSHGGPTAFGSGLGSSTMGFSMSTGMKNTMSNGTSGLSGMGQAPGMSSTMQAPFGGVKVMGMGTGVLPGTMNMGKPPSTSMAGVPDTFQPSTSPSSSSEWAVPKQSKLKYNQLFNTHDSHKTGYLSGVQARFILTGTGLTHQMLAQIWNLSDIDNDGKLTQEEFVLAMHLTDMAKSGSMIPAALPPNLIPPSYRRAAAKSGNALVKGENTNLLEPENAADKKEAESFTVFATFEDKRRDNFNKGNIELEKRRQALEESQRKEKERLERKEREEREKRERERQEQERRRQAELERQLEKQRAAEREREEARKKSYRATRGCPAGNGETTET